ncbi:MAG: hypothetical protein K5697_13210 [Lachnospiraceae bacterium]|nr:hypothetical protein [Lachnospiraceae bacterium]
MADDKLQEYQCPNCGGPLEFHGDVQKMVCVYCDAQFEMSQFNQNSPKVGDEQPTHWEQAQGQQLEAGEAGMKEFQCNACGAVMVSDGQVGATECPYCGNPAILESTFEGINLPDGIIPFVKSKQEAQDAMSGYYSGKKLLPNNFISDNRVEKIQGVYVPFWLFDCDVNGSAFYRAENRRTYSKGEERWEEIKEYAVSRSAVMRYEKVPADGSKEMKDEYMDSLEPYDFSKIIPYQPAYFSGYLANKYDESADDVKERVNRRIKNTSEQQIRDTVRGYDSVRTESSDIRINSGKIRYCMLPVWMLTTRWNGANYTFAMNGQTGKVTGDLPVDNGKATRMFLLTSVIALAILEALAYFIFCQDEISIFALIGAAVIALIIGGVTVSSAKASMVSHLKTEAKEFLVKDSFRLTAQNDRHIDTRHRKISGGN